MRLPARSQESSSSATSSAPFSSTSLPSRTTDKEGAGSRTRLEPRTEVRPFTRTTLSSPYVPRPVAPASPWNGKPWGEKSHASMRTYFNQQTKIVFDRPEFHEGAPDDGVSMRDKVRRAADTLAMDLANTCARTKDASVLQNALAQLKIFLELSFDDDSYEPPQGGGEEREDPPAGESTIARLPSIV